MRKMHSKKPFQFLGAALCAISLAACSSNTAPRALSAPAASDNSYLYGVVTPVASYRSVDSLDTSRYSADHLLQSSYLFQ
jgi:hypothetical protein